MAIKGKQHSSFSTKLRIYETLKEHLEPTGDGRVRYKDPKMSDSEVAKLIGDTTKHIVRDIRQAEFGHLRPFVNPVVDTEFRQTVSDLITQLNITRNELKELTTKHDTLCQTLSLNKVIDARHLAVKKQVAQQPRPNGPN